MTEETTLLLPIYSFYFILLLPGRGRAPHASGWGGVPRTLPLPMEGVKLLRDGPLAKAAFFCCVFYVCFNIANTVRRRFEAVAV